LDIASTLSSRAARRALVLVGLAVAAVVASTTMMFVFRPSLDKAHVALVYLLLVLAAAASGGLALGLGLAVTTFLCFNFFFLLPYHTFSVADSMDWLILGVYLITASVAAALLTRAKREAAARIKLTTEAEKAKTLREIDRLKDAVLATVSHDLRTPLTNIKALAYEISAGGDERADIIGTEADRLNRFVASLLDLSALNSGALRINLEINTIEDVVGATLAHVAQALNGRMVNTQIGEGAVMLARFDFVYTVRILGNLLENAHKYSPCDGPIDIAARQSGEWVEIAVSDRGSGIVEAERERIFQAFYRPQGSTPDAASAGLGLAIARRLAQAQGGTLRFEPRPNGGSTFILSLHTAGLSKLEPLMAAS
jgi:K+-sensing histidine kinase KdpD